MWHRKEGNGYHKAIAMLMQQDLLLLMDLPSQKSSLGESKEGLSKLSRKCRWYAGLQMASPPRRVSKKTPHLFFSWLWNCQRTVFTTLSTTFKSLSCRAFSQRGSKRFCSMVIKSWHTLTSSACSKAAMFLRHKIALPLPLLPSLVRWAVNFQQIIRQCCKKGKMTCVSLNEYLS